MAQETLYHHISASIVAIRGNWPRRLYKAAAGGIPASSYKSTIHAALQTTKRAAVASLHACTFCGWALAANPGT